MPRVKRSTKRNDRRKKILKRASGYFLTKSKLYQAALMRTIQSERNWRFFSRRPR